MAFAFVWVCFFILGIHIQVSLSSFLSSYSKTIVFCHFIVKLNILVYLLSCVDTLGICLTGITHLFHLKRKVPFIVCFYIGLQYLRIVFLMNLCT